jgi:hypothetical protein
MGRTTVLYSARAPSASSSGQSSGGLCIPLRVLPWQLAGPSREDWRAPPFRPQIQGDSSRGAARFYLKTRFGQLHKAAQFALLRVRTAASNAATPASHPWGQSCHPAEIRVLLIVPLIVASPKLRFPARFSHAPPVFADDSAGQPASAGSAP